VWKKRDSLDVVVSVSLLLLKVGLRLSQSQRSDTDIKANAERKASTTVMATPGISPEGMGAKASSAMS
jgi:hypothetical protein